MGVGKIIWEDAADVAARWKEFGRVDVLGASEQENAGAIPATIGNWEVHHDPQSPTVTGTGLQDSLFAGNGGTSMSFEPDLLMNQFRFRLPSSETYQV